MEKYNDFSFNTIAGLLDDGKIKEARKMLISVKLADKFINQDKVIRQCYRAVGEKFLKNVKQQMPKESRLTVGQTKLVVLVRVGFSNDEISELLGISIRSIIVVKSQIKRVLCFPKEMSFDDYIRQI